METHSAPNTHRCFFCGRTRSEDAMRKQIILSTSEVWVCDSNNFSSCADIEARNTQGYTNYQRCIP